MTVADALAKLPAGTPVAVVIAPGLGVGFAWPSGEGSISSVDPSSVIADLVACGPRWVWWSARETAADLVAAGVRVRTCWDLGAVGRLIHGLRRDDPAAVWAAQAGVEPADHHRDSLGLFDVDPDGDAPVRSDGQLSPEWYGGLATASLANAVRWATIALDLQRRQAASLATVDDPRRERRQPSLAVLTAYSESAAALVAVELEYDGLPIDRAVASQLIRAVIGDRPRDPAEEMAIRRERDATVMQHFPDAGDVDLRSPAQVKELLRRIGFDLPDTRSWRLEPHAATSPPIAALLAWRKVDRAATAYGWRWLDTTVSTDGRIHGAWGSADGGAGRMTATAGLHSLPAELRSAVRADDGHRLVRADLGQIEPRVLAAISGDEALLQATHEDDMYAPVAQRLHCDRPTAKVAVLAAMYGQTSGPAGDTIKMMERAYPTAVAYLRAAEQAGREHRDIRTYGGRLLRLSRAAFDATGQPVTDAVAAGHGRFARNAVVQGPAAELFKAWAATVRDDLIGYGGRIVLCLHDELLIQVPQAHMTATVRLAHDALALTARWWAAGTPVRFIAEVGTGVDWASAH